MLATVAIAYVMQKTPFVFPIIGGRKVEQLDDNIEALSIALSEEQVKYLESILPFNPGFPHSMVVSVALPDMLAQELTTSLRIRVTERSTPC